MMVMTVLYTLLMILVCLPSVKTRSSMAFQPDVKPANFVLFGLPSPKALHQEVILPEQIAMKFVKEQFGLATTDVTIKSVVPTKANDVTSVYLRQKLNGIEIVNAKINVNVNKYVEIIAFPVTSH